MGVFKTISKNSLVRQIVCALAALYIKAVYATTRWDERGRHIPDAFWKARKPFIIVFWHGRILMMIPCWKKTAPVHMLISQHRDGRLIADTIHHFGIGAIAGSSSKGGSAALRQMVRTLKQGEYVGITPDGPRGPRMRASPGMVTLARLAGVPIVPAAAATGNAKTLSSWDRFQLPVPFGRGVYLWGEAIDVADGEEDAARRHVEARLNGLTAEADRILGRPPVEPAPLADGNAPLADSDGRAS